MSRGFTARHAQTTGNFDFAVQLNAETVVAFHSALLSSGRMVPRVECIGLHLTHAVDLISIISNSALLLS